MKKTLCKVLVLALVLCMVLPQTVMAASYNVTVAVEQQGSSNSVSYATGYQHDSVKLVNLIAETFIAKEDEMSRVFETGLNTKVQEARAAYENPTAWATFVEGFDSSINNNDLKAILKDTDSELGALGAGSYSMSYTNTAVTPSETYVVTLTCTRKSSGGGGGAVAPVTPTQPSAVEGFADVDANEWYYSAVRYCIENGIMVGTSEDAFEPSAKLTRSMLLTMLAREAGVDTTAADSEPWYAKVMAWAVTAGVSDGTSPEADITREQLVTMLYRYVKAAGKDVSATADLSGYADSDSISDWALEAVQWAVATGLMKGVDATTIDPQGSATRAQAAQFFYNFKTLVLSK